MQMIDILLKCILWHELNILTISMPKVKKAGQVEPFLS